MVPLIFSVVLLGAKLSADKPQVQVDTIDGRSAVGAIEDLGGGRLILKTRAGQREFKLSQVQFVAAVERPTDIQPLSASSASANVARSKEQPNVAVQTIDGTRLSATEFQVAKGMATLKLTSGESIRVPTKLIHRVDFRLSGTAVEWPDLPKDAAGDLIIVRKNKSADMVEGIADDVSVDTVQFTVEGDVVPVKRAKVMGLLYFHPQHTAVQSEPAAIVESKTGSKINAAEVALSDDQLAITTTFGAKLAWPIESVRSIDFSPSRMTYLSDMQPDSVAWTPWLDLGGLSQPVANFYKPRFDSARDGGPLSIGGKTYRKGVALTPRTVLEYKIAGRGRQLRAIAGVDDSVHGAGHLQLEIEGDGQKLYSGKITGHDKPLELNLNVSNVKRLRIIADFGGGADVGDYLDLGSARIVK